MFLPDFTCNSEDIADLVLAEYKFLRKHKIKRFDQLIEKYQSYTDQSNQEIGVKLGINASMVWGWRNGRSLAKSSRVKDVARLLDIHPITLAIIMVLCRKDMLDRFGISYVINTVCAASGITLETFSKITHTPPSVRASLAYTDEEIVYTELTRNKLCTALNITDDQLQYLCTTQVRDVHISVRTIVAICLAFKDYSKH